MRLHRLALALPLATSRVAAVTLFACGGAVSKLGSGDGGAADADPGCPPAAQVVGGASCSTPNLSCPSNEVLTGCGGEPSPSNCTCGDNGVWQCLYGAPLPSCPPPPPPPDVCPQPSAVVVGEPCDTVAGLECTSNDPISTCDGTVTGYTSCTCDQSRWNCPEPGVPLCVDATVPCPPADSTFAGQACSPEGVTCAGDPTQCGGFVDYDDLECTGGTWKPIAVTSCGFIDAGVFDAGPPDVGLGI
jgi:hypothetical protein